MKFFVTGVNGQLGHDVMNELSSRSYEGIGSDIAPKYSGIQDDSPVTKMPYISLDITDNFYNIDIFHFVMSADIIDFTNTSIMDD